MLQCNFRLSREHYTKLERAATEDSFRQIEVFKHKLDMLVHIPAKGIYRAMWLLMSLPNLGAKRVKAQTLP